MRILQVSAFPISVPGGSQSYAHQLSLRLARRHEVHILTSRLHSLTGRQRRWNGIQIHEAPAPATFYHTPLTVALPYLLRESFDLLHVHHYVFFSSIQSAVAAQLRKTPYVLHLHGSVEPATPDSPSPSEWLYLRKKVFDLTLGRLTVRAAQVVASVSKRDVHVASQLFGIDQEVFRWIPNAVDSALLRRRWSGDRLERLTYLGRLERRKGTADLLRISRELLRRRHKLEIFITGRGSMAGTVRQEAARTKGRMRYLGVVPRSQMLEILTNSTILILPAYTEGVPTVVLEAMAVGTPTVASRVGGTPEIVKDGVTGFLFEAGDVEGCVELLEGLLADPSLLSSVSARGRKLVERWHTWERVVPMVEDLYESLLSDGT